MGYGTVERRNREETPCCRDGELKRGGEIGLEAAEGELWKRG